MASVKLLPIGNDAPFFLPTGVAASGYKLFTYAAGTTTKTNTYTDNTGNTANANPIILNSSGYPASGGNVIEIWGIVGTVYKFVLAPSTDSDPPVASIWSRDNISSINDQTQTFSEWVSGPTPTFVGGTQFTLVGDQTATWTIGRRVQATVTAGTVYGRITASAFTTLTTITLQLDGTQALDSGLSAVSYAMLGSLVKSEPERIGTSSGTDTYTATVGITRLVVGDEFKVKIASTNTSTTPTLNLDSTGAKTIVLPDGTALLAGDLNGEHIFRWNGTNQVVLNPTKSSLQRGTQTANTVFAGPTSGAAAVPTFRTLVGVESALVLLGSATASNSASLSFVHLGGTGTVTFDWTAYDEYEFHLAQLVPATNTQSLTAQISEDSGSSYKNASYVSTIADINAVPSGATAANSATTTAFNFSTLTISNSSDYGISGILRINKPSAAIKKLVRWDLVFAGTTSSLSGCFGIGQYSGDSGAWTGIKFIMSSGNLTSGTIYAYGVRKS